MNAVPMKSQLLYVTMTLKMFAGGHLRVASQLVTVELIVIAAVGILILPFLNVKMKCRTSVLELTRIHASPITRTVAPKRQRAFFVAQDSHVMKLGTAIGTIDVCVGSVFPKAKNVLLTQVAVQE